MYQKHMSKSVTIRLTDGELAELRRLANLNDSSRTAYVSESLRNINWPATSVDWDLLDMMRDKYAERGMHLRLMLEPMNDLVICANARDFRNSLAESAMQEIVAELETISELDKSLLKSLDTFHTVCDGAKAMRHASGKKSRGKTMSIGFRVDKDSRIMAEQECDRTGLSLTDLVLAQCVYVDAGFVPIDREVVQGFLGECSSQSEACETILRQTLRVSEVAKECYQRNPLYEISANLEELYATTSLLSHAYEKGMYVIINNGKLHRTL